MRSVHVSVGVALAVCLAFTGSVRSQGPAGRRATIVNSDGSVTIQNAVIQLSGLLSEGGRKVLMRTRPTEGPGAPVPLPTGIADIAEVRRVYNDNLKPNVDHMRAVFPVDIEETTIEGISAAIVTPKGACRRRTETACSLTGRVADSERGARQRVADQHPGCRHPRRQSGDDHLSPGSRVPFSGGE